LTGKAEPGRFAANVERKLTAILYTDVSGYSRLMGQDEEATLRTLASRRKLIEAIVEQHRGRFVNAAGDSILAEFASVINAVQAAVEIQAELKAANADLPPQRQMEFRIGVNLGDVIEEGAQIYGDGVNVAARLESLASPGGICISQMVQQNVKNKLALRYEDLGEQTVKNIAEPIRVFRVLPDIDTDTPPQVLPPALWFPATKRIPALSGVGLVLASIAAGIVIWKHHNIGPADTAEAQAHAIRSIAVLPLDNFSGDPKQEYFADGMTEELTTDLATISQLHVISRGSAMRFKGNARPSTPEIGRLLHVDAIVEGSVVRIGDRVRISAQLIDAPTDHHLWAKSFERDSRDVLALQDELASAIAKEIKVELTPSEQARLSSAPSVIPEAHDAYLKGRFFVDRPSDENLRKAFAQFNEAIKLDPHFAPAYSGLSDAYVWAGYNESVLTSAEAKPLANAAAYKAIQLDDTSAEGHTSLAIFRWIYE